MAPGEFGSHFVRCGKECTAKEGPAGGHWVWRCQQCADEGLNPWIYPWGHVVQKERLYPD
ncbi:hypothetical protein AB0878_44790 [Amycolatopsis sp. NPDC047767]|uniref:hypothetical protein n=1 Tax=Amycolatopsis sp. NPDC047767 TaxID=3156765 RepID=UPI003455A2A7